MLASGLTGIANDAWDQGMYNLYRNRAPAYQRTYRLLTKKFQHGKSQNMAMGRSM